MKLHDAVQKSAKESKISIQFILQITTVSACIKMFTNRTITFDFENKSLHQIFVVNIEWFPKIVTEFPISNA